MSKKDKNKKEKNTKKEGKNVATKEFKLNKDVSEMMKITLKKFKKNNDFYESKKELKKAYYAYLTELLPETIWFLVKYGHYENHIDIKTSLYEKITDTKFIKTVKKLLKDGEEIKNIELLPVIISDILREATKHAEETKKEQGENSSEEVTFDLSDLIELSKLILKKKIKKMVKSGIDENLAFDVLSIIPTPSILSKSPYYHVRMLFSTLYEHSKTKSIDFDKIMKILITEEYYAGVITFALLERKDKISNFNEKQQELFNKITEWCFNIMENVLDKSGVRTIITTYIQARQKDASQNNDTNRRYYLSSLPEKDYPKIIKIVNKIISEKPDVKKFL